MLRIDLINALATQTRNHWAPVAGLEGKLLVAVRQVFQKISRFDLDRHVQD